MGFWKDLADKWPIVALAPMDWYTDSAYRQIVKWVNKDVICFSEFYSADWLVHSKFLANSVLPHHISEKPLIIQIFWKDPEMFKKAAILIESYWIAWIDVNMWCPAKKVVQSWHGSSLMINVDTAYKIIEEMAKAVKIPISVKTRLWYSDTSNLINFAKWLENAWAQLITVHGRTFKQAFTGEADWTMIYELKKNLNIPVIGNWDVKDYEDGMRRITNDKLLITNETNLSNICHSRENGNLEKMNNKLIDCHASSKWQKEQNYLLDWFMIGRASFGNPWCFAKNKKEITMRERLDIMQNHAELLIELKWKKWALESRKHMVQYLFGFPWVKHYRSELVRVENYEDVVRVLNEIRRNEGV